MRATWVSVLLGCARRWTGAPHMQLDREVVQLTLLPHLEQRSQSRAPEEGDERGQQQCGQQWRVNEEGVCCGDGTPGVPANA
eukprot:2617967-Prymnesium_polylepis.1